MTKFSGKQGGEAEASQTTWQSMDSKFTKEFSEHMSPNDVTPRKLHEATAIPPIWLSGILESIKSIKTMVHKNNAEVVKLKNEALKKKEIEEKVIVEDPDKDLLDTDDKKEWIAELIAALF